MRKWYEKGDELYAKLVKVIKRTFRQSRLTLDFDNINQPVKTIKTESVRLYKVLARKNREHFFDLADWVYMEAYLEGLPFSEEMKGRNASDSKISKIAKKAITDKWMDKELRKYSPSTKYVYANEVERKRARFFEAVVSDAEMHNRREMEEDYATAERSWTRQAKQEFIDIEDAAAKRAYKDVGVQYVRWVAEKDDKTCDECLSLDGLVFLLRDVPDKPHYNCRCRLEPVNRQ